MDAEAIRKGRTPKKRQPCLGGPASITRNDGYCSCIQCMADHHYQRGYQAGYRAGQRSRPIEGQEQLFTDDQYDFSYGGLLP